MGRCSGRSYCFSPYHDRFGNLLLGLSGTNADKQHALATAGFSLATRGIALISSSSEGIIYGALSLSLFSLLSLSLFSLLSLSLSISLSFSLSLSLSLSHTVTRNMSDAIIAAGGLSFCLNNPGTNNWFGNDQPGYVSDVSDPNNMRCVGFKKIPDKVPCDGKYSTMRRLCACDLNGRVWSKACETHTSTCSSVLVLKCPPGLELDVASAMFNGTNCGIDVSTEVKKQCHGKDNCQIYAPTIGNSGCNPGTSTLWVQYSCAGILVNPGTSTLWVQYSCAGILVSPGTSTLWVQYSCAGILVNPGTSTLWVQYSCAGILVNPGTSTLWVQYSCAGILVNPGTSTLWVQYSCAGILVNPGTCTLWVQYSCAGILVNPGTSTLWVQYSCAGILVNCMVKLVTKSPLLLQRGNFITKCDQRPRISGGRCRN
eukprot:sb/3464946/